MIYTSIDLGSNTIKIVVTMKNNDKFYVLASANVKSKGIKKGYIKDKELALQSLKEGINSINKDLGIEIKEVLLNFPMQEAASTIETAEVNVNGIVTGNHIKEVISASVLENIPNELEVIYIEPIIFELDSGVQLPDPKGQETGTLKVRCAVSTIEKEILYEYLELLHEAGLEVVDVNYGVVGDYFESKNHDTDMRLGVLVNLGYGKTEIGVFNKGIFLRGTSIPEGSSKLDKDISYIYKIDRKYATSLKENFAVASSKYADQNDVIEVVNQSGEEIKINQLEISQVVEARLVEIIKNVKNEVNRLTNREISYIIVTGGITNLTGFPYLLDMEFDCDKVICNMITLGVRSNIYSASLGFIKYYDNKLKFRDIKHTMLDSETTQKLTEKKKEVDKDSNIINKLKTYKES